MSPGVFLFVRNDFPVSVFHVCCCSKLYHMKLLKSVEIFRKMLYDSEKAFGRRDENPSAWQKRLAGVEIQPDQKAGCKDAVFRRKCGRLLAESEGCHF